MNKKFLYTFGICFSLLSSQILLTNTAVACSPHAGTSACHCHHKHLAQLNLTPEQQTQVKAIFKKAHATKAAARKKLAAINAEIKTLNKADKTKLNSLLNQKKEAEGTIVKAKALKKQEIYMILTPAQKLQYDEMMKASEKNKMNNKKHM